MKLIMLQFRFALLQMPPSRCASHALQQRSAYCREGAITTSTRIAGTTVYAAMVTSTSTPASMLMMICLTTSVGALRSMSRLWIRISYMSHVFEPSPQGVFRVVTWEDGLADCHGRVFVDSAGLQSQRGLQGTSAIRRKSSGEVSELMSV